MAKETKLDIVEVVDNPYIIRFVKPYEFEGKTYTELDLTPCGYHSLTAADIVACKNLRRKQGWTAASAFDNMASWTDDEMIQLIVCRKCGLPFEFFNNLPYTEFFRIQTAILSLVGGAGLA